MTHENELIIRFSSYIGVFFLGFILFYAGLRVEHPYNTGRAEKSIFHEAAIASELIGCLFWLIAIVSAISGKNPFIDVLVKKFFNI